MHSTDFTKPVTTESLLQQFESRFNQTMDLSKFTKEELEVLELELTKLAEPEPPKPAAEPESAVRIFYSQRF